MKTWIKVVLWIICIFTVFTLIGFATGGVQLLYNKIFLPANENVRREAFEQTRSFNEGKIQDLNKWRLEYMKAKDPMDKKLIKQTILQAFVDYDDSKLPSDLQQFLRTLKNDLN